MEILEWVFENAFFRDGVLEKVRGNVLTRKTFRFHRMACNRCRFGRTREPAARIVNVSDRRFPFKKGRNRYNRRVHRGKRVSELTERSFLEHGFPTSA